MNNGLCPHCGCLMEKTGYNIPIDFEGEETVTALVSFCPCCDYEETTYED